MKLINTKLLLSFVLTIVLLLVSSDTWRSKGIFISFKVETTQNFDLRLFYLKDSGSSFSESLSVHRKILPQNTLVEILLPSKYCYGLKFDFSNLKSDVKLSDFVVKGRKVVFLDLKDFALNGKTAINGQDDYLHLPPPMESQVLVYTGNLDVKKGVVGKIDWLFLLILSSLFMPISYKIVEYLARFKIIERYSRVDIVFLVAFFCVLFTPMLYISDEEISVKENRRLAVAPHFMNDKNIGGVNFEYGNDFNKWFDDRFGGRKDIIKIYERLIGFINGIHGNNKVLVGNDGWLFYKGDNSIKNFQNKSVYSDEDKAKVLKYLSDIDKWCRKHKKKFYVVIAPDKNRIYGEFIPKSIKKINGEEFGVAQQFVDYIQQHSDIKILYLKETLLQQKESGLLFFKNDTHWNEYGAYLGYKAVIDLMKTDIPVSCLSVDRWNIVEENRTAGDLFNMYSSVVDSKNEKYKRPSFSKNAVCHDKDSDGIKIAVCKNPQKRFRAFLLRDSFSSNLLPYFAETFKDIEAHWTYQISKKDLKSIKSNDDIVILEVVERYVPLLSLTFPEEVK